MKIFVDNSVYVQKEDVAYLYMTSLDLPDSIYTKVFGQGMIVFDNSNRYDFIEFSEPSEIDFFKKIDWIIDYNEVKNLTEEELIKLGKEIAKEKKRKVKGLNGMPSSQRIKNYDRVLTELECLDFKMHTLRDIILLKKKELDYPFPEYVEKPSVSVTDLQDTENTSSNSTIKSKFKHLIKTIVKK